MVKLRQAEALPAGFFLELELQRTGGCDSGATWGRRSMGGEVAGPGPTYGRSGWAGGGRLKFGSMIITRGCGGGEACFCCCACAGANTLAVTRKATIAAAVRMDCMGLTRGIAARCIYGEQLG
jgi:hypothetical protein